MLNAIVPSASTNLQKPFEQQYLKGQHLGSGHYGDVYQVVEKATKGVFACKEIPKRDPKRPLDTQAVRLEIHALQLLGQHLDIVALHAVVEDKDKVYLIMQLCRGGELFGHILSQGSLNERQARAHFKSMLTAVDACHTQGIMHRDIKPGHFLVAHKDGNAVVTLADFGLSAPFKSYSALHDAVGSPLYAPPDLMDGSDLSYSCKVDIWSLGVTLYALMCGGLTPFRARAGKTLEDSIVHDALEFPGSPWGQVSGLAKDMMRQMLRKDPKQRPSAQQLLQHPWFLLEYHGLDKPLDGVMHRLSVGEEGKRQPKEKRLTSKDGLEQQTGSITGGLEQTVTPSTSSSAGHQTSQETVEGPCVQQSQQADSVRVPRGTFKNMLEMSRSGPKAREMMAGGAGDAAGWQAEDPSLGTDWLNAKKRHREQSAAADQDSTSNNEVSDHQHRHKMLKTGPTFEEVVAESRAAQAAQLPSSSHQALHMQQDPVQQKVQQSAQAPFSQSGGAGRAKKQTGVANQGQGTRMGPAFNTRSRGQQSLGEGEAAGDGRSRQISQPRSRKRAAGLVSTDVALPAVPDHEQTCEQQGRPAAKRVRYNDIGADATQEDISAAHMEGDDTVHVGDAPRGDSQDVRGLSGPAAKARKRGSRATKVCCLATASRRSTRQAAKRGESVDVHFMSL